jgi:hypothetical protein
MTCIPIKKNGQSRDTRLHPKLIVRYFSGVTRYICNNAYVCVYKVLVGSIVRDLEIAIYMRDSADCRICVDLT